MSQITQRRPELRHLPAVRIDIDDSRNAPQSESNRAPWEDPSLSDTSDPMFSMYVKMAEEEDDKMAERCKADADGILIFTGLFSASVAALAAVSVQDLKPNSQDTSAFYLENIFQLLVDANLSSTILSTPIKPPKFVPPRSAIWVNSLWFLSLVISLTCALLATLLKQWAHRYINITQPPRYRPHKRARIRAFIAEGVEKYHLPWAVGASPALLHLSLFLFFASLLIYLSNINHTVFNVTVWWVGLSVGGYTCITFMPIFRHDSPYYAPLSTSVWFLCYWITYVALKIRCLIQIRCLHLPDAQILRALKDRYRKILSEGMGKTIEDTAWKLSERIDGHVFKWTLNALDEDHGFERFCEGIPGLYKSNVIEVPETVLEPVTILSPLGDFFLRTEDSNLASESVKQRRLVICLRATRAVFQSLSIGYGHYPKSLNSYGTKSFGLLTQTMVACIIATARERDDRWFTLAMDQFGVSERLLRHYLANGNSMLMANLNQIFRKICYWIFKDDVDLKTKSWVLLQLLTQFDPQNTLPELQHDFCVVWNEVVEKSRKDENYFTPFFVLHRIRHIFIALHPGINTTSPVFAASTDPFDPIFFEGSSYPLCDIADHRCLYSVPQLYENQGTIPSGSASIPSIAPYFGAIPTVPPSSTRPNLSSFPLSDPDFTRPHPADESLPPGVPHARQCFASTSSLSHPVSESPHHAGLPIATTDLATAGAEKRITVISSPASPIRRSTPRGDVAPLPITPHSVVHYVPSARTPVHTASSVAPAEPLLYSGSTAIRSGSIPNEPVPPPPDSTIVALSASPQKASVSDPDPDIPTMSSPLDKTQDLNPPPSVELPNRPNTSTPGVATGTLISDEDGDSSEDLAISTHDQIDIAD